MTNTDDFISVRRYGDFEVAVVHTAVLHWNPPFPSGGDWRPKARLDDDGLALLGSNSVVVKAPGAVIFADPNSFTDMKLSTATLVAGPPIETVLEALEIDPNEVTHVPITHGHSDHFTALLNDDGGLRFPNADILYPAADVPADSDTGMMAEEARHMIHATEPTGKLKLVSGDHEIVPGVTLLHAPGETRGHQVLRVETDTDSVYYLGDLVHFPVEVENLDWVCSPGRDTDALVVSRTRIFSDPGDKTGTFVYTHAAFPGWGHVEPTAEGGWLWQFE